MKDGVLFILVTLGGIAGIAWFVMSYGSGFRPFQSVSPRTSYQEPVATNRPAVEKRKAAPKQSKPHLPEEIAVVQPTLPEPPVRPAASLVTPGPRPFPSPGDISVGVQKAQIVEAFGDPTLAMTATDRGHVAETFVYQRNRRQSPTIIRLEDGKVLAAYRP